MRFIISNHRSTGFQLYLTVRKLKKSPNQENLLYVFLITDFTVYQYARGLYKDKERIQLV